MFSLRETFEIFAAIGKIGSTLRAKLPFLPYIAAQLFTSGGRLALCAVYTLCVTVLDFCFCLIWWIKQFQQNGFRLEQRKTIYKVRISICAFQEKVTGF